jgi:RNA polymerase sigma-70 factor (ECF subfamily)
MSKLSADYNGDAQREELFNAVAVMFRNHRERLFRLALRYTRNHAAADDAVQNATIKVLKRLEKGLMIASENLLGYLARAVQNAAIDWRRRTQRYYELEVDITVDEWAPSWYKSDAKHSREHRFAVEFDRFIETLPPKCRETFILYFIKKKSQKHIARRMHCSVRTVEVQIYRARQKLRKWLRAHGYER